MVAEKITPDIAHSESIADPNVLRLSDVITMLERSDFGQYADRRLWNASVSAALDELSPEDAEKRRKWLINESDDFAVGIVYAWFESLSRQIDTGSLAGQINRVSRFYIKALVDSGRIQLEDV